MLKKQFTCDICGDSFSTNGSLERHKGRNICSSKSELNDEFKSKYELLRLTHQKSLDETITLHQKLDNLEALVKKLTDEVSKLKNENIQLKQTPPLSNSSLGLSNTEQVSNPNPKIINIVNYNDFTSPDISYVILDLYPVHIVKILQSSDKLPFVIKKFMDFIYANTAFPCNNSIRATNDKIMVFVNNRWKHMERDNVTKVVMIKIKEILEILENIKITTDGARSNENSYLNTTNINRPEHENDYKRHSQQIEYHILNSTRPDPRDKNKQIPIYPKIDEALVQS
jgi:hypothetical protein